MVSYLWKRYFWVGMSSIARVWATKCLNCVIGKRGTQAKAPLCSKSTSYPFETVALDFLLLGRPLDMHPYFLVVTDVFSHYALAICTQFPVTGVGGI